MKLISLCADDFGYSDAVSQGIISLSEQQRLSATSCLTNFTNWAHAATKLNPLAGHIDIGLHLNFTEGKALNSSSQSLFSSLNPLIIRSHLRLLNRKKIKQEINAQLDQFEQCLGRSPDFIDGHQHIHQLPLIREELLAIYQERFPDKAIMIRVASNPLIASIKQSAYCLKTLIITLTGALQLKKRLEQLNIPHNTSFAGIYDLKPSNNYAKHFERFVSEVNTGGLIMCHPADGSDTKDDVIAKTRQQEFDFFTSEQFLQQLNQQQAELQRFSQLPT